MPLWTRRRWHQELRIQQHNTQQRLMLAWVWQMVPSTDSGHAFLHDFCVTIPYGSVVGVLAVIAYLQHTGSLATTLLAASLSVLSLTYLSLQNWRARKPCRPYTLLTAGVCND